MATNLPPAGNQPHQGLAWPAPARARGAALISVVAVLVLLALIITPFAITMRDSLARGERRLFTAQVNQDAESLFELIRVHLSGTLEHVEYRRMREQMGSSRYFEYDDDEFGSSTPASDTWDEYAIPADVLARFNRRSGGTHRVWSVDIRDQQALFDLNGSSFPAFANLLGRTELVRDLPADDGTLHVSDATDFPEKDGVIRVGSEVVRYEVRDDNTFYNCQRGYLASLPENARAQPWQMGDTVILEAAFQIATRPYRLHPGEIHRYTNVYQARSVAEMGVAGLGPEAFDALRPHITAWTGTSSGDGWNDPQPLLEGITKDAEGPYLIAIGNPGYYAPGTIVKVTDGAVSDYGVVMKVVGDEQVLIAGDFKHGYSTTLGRIYARARSPINLNTATYRTLVEIFRGLRLKGATLGLSRMEAEALATHMRAWVRPESDDAPGVYRNWEDVIHALETARDIEKILDADQFQAVVRNAMNANDARLAFSTVPFCLRSFDHFEVRATVSNLNWLGQELARREIRRVLVASTNRSEVITVESQEDFQRHVMRTRDGKWWATWPNNVNAHYDGKNVPASEFNPYAQRDRFPDTQRATLSGDVRLLPSRFNFYGREEIDRHFHFDGSELHDGQDVSVNPFAVSMEGPYDTFDHTVDLIERVEIDDEEIELGMKEFTLSFLYKPYWSRGGADQTILDHGLEHDHVNRVSLRYDGKRDELVLGVADAARESRTAEVAYDFEDIEWEPGQWYHIGIVAHGCRSDLLELFIDGEKVGKPNYQTTLRGGILGDADIFQIAVEDARSFPSMGVLLLKGIFGTELVEYRSRGTRNFIVHRRYSRTVDEKDKDLTFRPHDDGAVVQLYGFTGVLHTDLVDGGARLPGPQGPWRMYRMTSGGDIAKSCFLAAPGDELPPGAVKSSDPDCPPPADPDSEEEPYEVRYPGLVHGQGHEPEIQLVEWDTAEDGEELVEDLGPIGTEGIAMIVSPRVTVRDDDDRLKVAAKGNDPNWVLLDDAGLTGGDDEEPEMVPAECGGVDFVHFEVVKADTQDGLRVKLVSRALDLRHVGSKQWMELNGTSGRFIPMYSYGAEDEDPWALDPDSQQGGGGGVGTPPPPAGASEKGFWTAFIPIGIVGEGSGDIDYLDPFDAEPQLEDADGDKFAYVQIGTEWVKYDTYDTETIANSHVFYRDTRIRAQIDDYFENVASSILHVPASVSASDREPGGSGGPDPGTIEPPHALDTNDANHDPYEPVGVPGGGVDDGGVGPPTPPGEEETYSDPPFETSDVVEWFDFRSFKRGDDFYFIANTRPRDHENDELILPAFKVFPGNDIENGPAARGAYPGFDDLLTLRSYDPEKDDEDKFQTEQVRVKWGYKGWAALTDDTIQTWGWDRPDDDTADQVVSRTIDPRYRTRVLKFPSAEMPDAELTLDKPDLVFAEPFDAEGSYTPAVVDELTWPYSPNVEGRRPPRAHLGKVPDNLRSLNSPLDALHESLLRFEGIYRDDEEISVHLGHYVNPGKHTLASGYQVVDVFPDDGGVIAIEGELIQYEAFDEATGKFTGCLRGAFGTEPMPHQYGAAVIPIYTFPTTRLTAPIGMHDAFFEMSNLRDFPDAGYIRVADGTEIIGYTSHDTRGSATMRRGSQALVQPLARIDPGEINGDPEDEEARVGGPLFRGRFSTVPEEYKAGDLAMFLPFRVWDRYAERSDDPENAYVQLAFTRPGAIWKRVTWSVVPEDFAEVVGLVRFAGGPAWDSADVVRVGEEELPNESPAAFLYQITDPEQMNLLNIESDRLELRLMVRYAEGAYDRLAEVRPDNWKNSPWVQKVRVEVISPSMVLYQE